MEKEKRKLFLGGEVVSPWVDIPEGERVIAQEMRHVTLAFLGYVEECPELEVAPFEIGPVGILDSLLFLPPEKERVVAYSMQFLTGEEAIRSFQAEVSGQPFLPHVSIVRSSRRDSSFWKAWFTPLPFFTKAIHLYESVGNLQYVPLKSQRLQLPFSTVEHTADIAFLVRGKDLDELYLHAGTALAFSYPSLISFLKGEVCSSLEEVVMALNQLIAKVDIEIGCPFKAVSFQGELVQTSIYEWEMIVDV